MSEPPVARSTTRSWCGRVLFVLGLALGIIWFVWGSPLQQSLLLDEAVRGQNSPAWWEVHRRGSRILWQHDDFANIGYFGTKRDVEWIIDGGDAGEVFGDCSNGHRASALENITNQSPGRTKEAWQEWWKQNSGKRQSEWILEGFVKHGIPVSLPLDRPTELKLLQFIGRYTRPATELTEEEAKMDHVRFNALRLLRDRKFDPAGVTVQELTVDETGEVMKGLVALARWEAAHPWENGVGVVFGSGELPNPPRLHPVAHWLGWIWLGLSCLCLGGGLWLLRSGWR